MSVFANWLKKKKKEATPQEEEFKPIGFEQLQEIIARRLARLDQLAKSRKNRQNLAVQAKIEKSVHFNMSLSHWLKALAIRKHLGR